MTFFFHTVWKKEIKWLSGWASIYIYIIHSLDNEKCCWMHYYCVNRLSSVPVFCAKCWIIKGTIVITKILDWLVYVTVMLRLPDDIESFKKVGKIRTGYHRFWVMIFGKKVEVRFWNNIYVIMYFYILWMLKKYYFLIHIFHTKKVI